MRVLLPPRPGSLMRLLRSSRGIALAASLAWLSMLLLMGTGIVSYTTQGTIRVAGEENSAILLNAAEAGLQAQYNNLWRPFRIAQRFPETDEACQGASLTNPREICSGVLNATDGVVYQSGVVEYTSISNYTRRITIASIGWIDEDGDRRWDSGEPRKDVESRIELRLERSKVFDYAYMVNNYGWMFGFSASELVVNGDMRANGDFDFTGGRPTINGSVYACENAKLIPGARGVVNVTPTQWTNSYYASHAPIAARSAYNSATMGAKGSDTYEKWRDIIYDMDASLVRGKPAGAVVGDSTGTRSYNNTILSSEATEEVVMPDLSDINYYLQESRNYIDRKTTYQDGTANPQAGQPAYIEVYNSSRGRYERLTTNGAYSGSAALIGTASKPIKLHGPVTVTGDVVIKGVVSGQGCIYAGRNVHIVGNVVYNSGPNFTGSDIQQVDRANEKKDMLGLAARGSIIMGNTKQFDNSVFQYMTPPFTKARYDDYGRLIPAFNAKEVDSTGKKRYQSTFGDDYISNVSENINQINAVLYTNFLGGGKIGQGGGGVTFNGSIISRDEAMAMQSLPLKMNYDNRLRWRADMNEPLIDIRLPLSPVFASVAWGEMN